VPSDRNLTDESRTDQSTSRQGKPDQGQPDPNWTDQRIETLLANLLRAGVLFSALIVLIGGAIYLRRHGRARVDFRVFRGEPADLRSIYGVIRDGLAMHGRGIIQLGLLLLIATPVARVAFSIFGFAAERDRMYVVFTVIVFCVLLYSLLGSA
jgi:uncharacterized membrane protein